VVGSADWRSGVVVGSVDWRSGVVVGSADWIPGRELYVPHLLRSCTSDMFCSPRGVRRQ